MLSDKNNEEKAVLETTDMEGIRSVAAIRVITCTILVFGHFCCELCKDCWKILRVMASKFKENDVSFNKFTPHVKLSKELLNLKTKHYAQEIRQLRESNNMLLGRIKSITDDKRVLLESDINDICCKAKNILTTRPRFTPILFMGGTATQSKGKKQWSDPCNDKMVLKYIFQVSR